MLLVIYLMQLDYYILRSDYIMSVDGETTKMVHRFMREFDELNGDIFITGIQFSASDILRKMDEIAYNKEFHNWLDCGYQQLLTTYLLIAINPL